MSAQALREIAGPAGRLEVLIDLPARPPRAVVVLAHPHPEYGGTMHTKMVYQGAKGFTRIGCAVVRFNFRSVGLSAGTFDAGPGEMDDFRAAIAFAAERFPGLPIWAAGASFGAWIAVVVGAEDPRVSMLVAIAPPVDRFDFAVLTRCEKPKFFIHGEEDELISIRLVRELYAKVPEPKELAVIDAASHLFEGCASEVGEAIEELLVDWGPGAGRAGS
jgi:uncharacterized protein